MTDKQFETLSRYDGVLYTATYCQFARVQTTADLEAINKVWREIYGTNSRLLNSCQRCVLRDLKTIGELYFKEKKAREAVEKELEPKLNDSELEKKAEKKTRKKKTEE